MKKLVLMVALVSLPSHIITENKNSEKLQNKIKSYIIYGSGLIAATTILSCAHEIGHIITVRAIDRNAHDSLKWEGLFNDNFPKIFPYYTFPKFKNPLCNLIVQVAGPLVGFGLSYCALKLSKSGENNSEKKSLLCSGIRTAAYLTIATELIDLIPAKIKGALDTKINIFNYSIKTLNHVPHGYYILKDVKTILNTLKK